MTVTFDQAMLPMSLMARFSNQAQPLQPGIPSSRDLSFLSESDPSDFEPDDHDVKNELKQILDQLPENAFQSDNLSQLFTTTPRSKVLPDVQVHLSRFDDSGLQNEYGAHSNLSISTTSEETQHSNSGSHLEVARLQILYSSQMRRVKELEHRLDQERSASKEEFDTLLGRIQQMGEAANNMTLDLEVTSVELQKNRVELSDTQEELATARAKIRELGHHKALAAAELAAVKMESNYVRTQLKELQDFQSGLSVNQLDSAVESMNKNHKEALKKLRDQLEKTTTDAEAKQVDDRLKIETLEAKLRAFAADVRDYDGDQTSQYDDEVDNGVDEADLKENVVDIVHDDEYTAPHNQQHDKHQDHGQQVQQRQQQHQSHSKLEPQPQPQHQQQQHQQQQQQQQHQQQHHHHHHHQQQQHHHQQSGTSVSQLAQLLALDTSSVSCSSTFSDYDHDDHDHDDHDNHEGDAIDGDDHGTTDRGDNNNFNTIATSFINTTTTTHILNSNNLGPGFHYNSNDYNDIHVADIDDTYKIEATTSQMEQSLRGDGDGVANTIETLKTQYEERVKVLSSNALIAKDRAVHTAIQHAKAKHDEDVSQLQSLVDTSRNDLHLAKQHFLRCEEKRRQLESILKSVYRSVGLRFETDFNTTHTHAIEIDSADDHYHHGNVNTNNTHTLNGDNSMDIVTRKIRELVWISETIAEERETWMAQALEDQQQLQLEMDQVTHQLKEELTNARNQVATHVLELTEMSTLNSQLVASLAEVELAKESINAELAVKTNEIKTNTNEIKTKANEINTYAREVQQLRDQLAAGNVDHDIAMKTLHRSFEARFQKMLVLIQSFFTQSRPGKGQALTQLVTSAADHVTHTMTEHYSTQIRNIVTILSSRKSGNLPQSPPHHHLHYHHQQQHHHHYHHYHHRRPHHQHRQHHHHHQQHQQHHQHHHHRHHYHHHRHHHHHHHGDHHQ